MKRILIKVAYDGTGYNGWQLAKDGISVEGLLTEAVKELTGEDVKISGTSRTDAGVHSRGNLAVFDTDSTIPPEKFALALNTKLPEDIRVIMSEETGPDVHPRFLRTEKTYLYRIQRGEFPDPLRSRYSWHVSYPLNIDAMREAAGHLIGEHDFRAFCSVHTDAKTTVREITGVSLEEKEDEIHLTVRGYGFLYNMVRIIAGTLMEVGRGRISPDEIPGILSSKDRENAGPTAPARGLTLMDIKILE